MSPRKSALRIALAGAAALSLPATALAAPQKTFDESTGFADPRKRKLPRTHRFRLALSSNYLRLSRAEDTEGNSQRFHYAPLMIDAAYQAQFAKYLMARIAIAMGGNLANSRNAMPAVFLPKAYFGFQGKLFGLAATYGYMLAFPLVPGATALRGPNPLEQPIIRNNHVIGGELSFTTRVDRVALTFAAGMAAVNSHLIHYDIDSKRWRPMLMLSFGAYFDGSIIRSRRAQKREQLRAGSK